MMNPSLLDVNSRPPRKFLLAAWAALAALLASFSLFIPQAHAAGSSDTTPPTLTSFFFFPPVVDVTSRDFTVSIFLNVMDDQAGLQFAEVRFYSPSGQVVYADAAPVGAPVTANLQLTVTIPQSSNANDQGNWFAEVYLADAAGNATVVDALALAGLGSPSALSVITSGAPGGDITPPVLAGFNIYPKSVNVASSDASVTVDLQVKDDLSGFATADVIFVGPSGQNQSVTANLTTGTSLDGRAQGTLILPQASEAGAWSVSSVVLHDVAGNASLWDTAVLSSSGFPTALTVSATPQLSDTTPPVLVSFDFTPKSVDVTNADASVDVTLHFTDDLSGFSYAYAYFYSPTFGQYSYAYLYPVAGSSLNGDAQGTMTLTQSSDSGNWIVDQVILYDNVGNYQYLYHDTLSSLGFPTALAVTSNNADVTPPQLKSFALAPAAIDVSFAPQSIRFTIGSSDDKSGLDFCQRLCYETVGLRSPSGKQTQWGHLATQLSGTPQNGVWEIVVTLPMYAEAGLWRVNYVYLHDMTGNSVSFDAAALQSSGFPSTIAVNSFFSDIQLPQLTSLSFMPNFADTTAGAKAITLTIGATDNLSGIGSGGFGFSSPSGNQHLSIYSGGTPVAGTATHGTWQATGYLPQYSEAGTWTLTGGYLTDAVGNFAPYSNAQLKASGIPTSLQVILPSLVSDGTIADPAAGGTVQDSVFGNRAEVTVPPGVLSQPATVSLDVLSSDLHLPIPAGFTANGTNFVNIKLDPEPTPPFAAPGLTIVLPLLNQMPPGDSLILYRVDPVSGKLTPEPGIGGAIVTGTVDAPDGLSATFTGVASLSTVTGLIPSGAVLGDLDGDGLVNCADISIVRVAFGKKLGQTGFDSRADTNHDNVVDVRDLAFVSRNLPKSVVCRIIPTGAIPVPNTPAALTNTRR